MAVTAPTERDPLAKQSRFTGVRRTFAPVLHARGQARWMLWLGAAITLAFVVGIHNEHGSRPHGRPRGRLLCSLTQRS